MQTSALHRPTRRDLLIAGAACALAGNARAAYQLRPWPAGRSAPKLELNDLAGKAWSLQAHRGHVLVLNFWATWCEPCRAEMPSLELMAQRLERDGVVVVAVNYQEAIPTIQRFLAAQPVSLPILLDRDGEATSAWTSRVFPTTVLIDRTGQPRFTVLGEMDWTGSAARQLVDPLVAQARST